MTASNGADLSVAEIIAANRRAPSSPPRGDVQAVLQNPAVALAIHTKVSNAVEDAKATAAHEGAAYYLNVILMAIRAAMGQSNLSVGAILDEALTEFFADLKAELGPEQTEMLVALMIRNLAFWLRDERRDHIRDYLKPETVAK